MNPFKKPVPTEEGSKLKIKKSMPQFYSSFTRTGLLFFCFLITLAVTAQQSLLSNEEIVFTFKTQSGKQMWLNKDKKDKYLIYRYGTKDKIEFQFPDTTKTSFSKFTYSFTCVVAPKQMKGLIWTISILLTRDLSMLFTTPILPLKKKMR
jgi:hypothetical protein